MNILLVDDERLARVCTQSMLEEAAENDAVTCHHADGAAQARAWIALHGAPDIAFVDYKMPRCSGLELIEWAAPQCPGTLWVLLSGYDLSEEANRIQAAGVRVTLSKPTGVAELAAILKEVQHDHSHCR